MVTSLRKDYFWPGMKREVVEYLEKCLEHQQMKAKHQYPSGLLQLLPISKWKWEVITLYFIARLPKSKTQNDTIMVVEDKLRKSTYFVPLQSTYKAFKLLIYL